MNVFGQEEIAQFDLCHRKLNAASPPHAHPPSHTPLVIGSVSWVNMGLALNPGWPASGDAGLAGQLAAWNKYKIWSLFYMELVGDWYEFLYVNIRIVSMDNIGFLPLIATAKTPVFAETSRVDKPRDCPPQPPSLHFTQQYAQANSRVTQASVRIPT